MKPTAQYDTIARANNLEQIRLFIEYLAPVAEQTYQEPFLGVQNG